MKLNRMVRRPRLDLRQGPFNLSLPLTGRGRPWAGINGTLFGVRLRASRPAGRRRTRS
jgi:hypothetical protein